LPIQIGWNLSVEKIDTFFERQETRGYKFDIDSKGNVFIVEMVKDEHTAVVKRLDKYFEVPNGGVADDPPIDVLEFSSKKNSFGSFSLVISFITFSCPIKAHYKPCGRDKPSAPDIAIFPGLSIIPKPPTPPSQCGLRAPSRHNEIPPVNKTVGSVHIRFIPHFFSLVLS
jgi:hypothetical protein